MQDPYRFVSGDVPARNQQGSQMTGQAIREKNRDCADNPFHGSTDEGSYFQVISRLNELRDRVRTSVGPSACDLIRLLDRIACQSSFDPVGAAYEGRTADEFFWEHPEFNRLESELGRKICPTNVSEVFTLMKEASYYTPTRRIIRLIEAIYRRQLADDPEKT